MTLINKDLHKITWAIRVPILRNRVILKQLGFAIGIPFGLLIIFLLIIKAFYGVGLIVLLFLLTYLFITVVWGGKYDVGFELDQTGVRCFTLANQAKRNKILNALTVVAGLLSGKPAVAGAGMLAQSQQDVQIKWKRIKRVKYIPLRQVIMINAGFAENIALFCKNDNYDEVEMFVRSHLGDKESQGK